MGLELDGGARGWGAFLSEAGAEGPVWPPKVVGGRLLVVGGGAKMPASGAQARGTPE